MKAVDFNSKSIELSGKIIDGCRESSVLFSENSDLVGQISNGSFSIGQGSLKR